ncbi:hypothetical protein JOE30_000739 [Rhodococcus sp. PvP016]|uniref:Uncharacterized protein n=1 Tax=Rhodococcoides corynebacterioides TaxID=53972 RepID=A0ABS2KXM9_9NOCA|nr:hypothetical protein [Rhodococcus corynebacterioides]MBP1114942.1 hypothetical protein [Rhodococcus sp. PvP016]
MVLLEISAVPRTAGGVLMVASSANSSSVATRAGERQDRSTHVAGDRSRVLTASNEVKPRYPGDRAPVTMTRLEHDDHLAGDRRGPFVLLCTGGPADFAVRVTTSRPVGGDLSPWLCIVAGHNAAAPARLRARCRRATPVSFVHSCG